MSGQGEEVIGVPRDALSKRVIGIFDVRSCPALAGSARTLSTDATYHIGGLVIDDESEIVEGDAIALIDAGAALSMIPPPGAPARAAHVATGLPLLLQVRTCEHCGERVLFA